MIAKSKDSAEFPLGFVEFVALIASMMALNALSIDPMLPALPAIGEALGIAEENHRQWIISSYFLGMGVGAIFYGSLSDRFGRKPVLLVTLSLYLVATVFCTASGSFAMMLAGRIAAGFFAAAVRVVAISIVRDRFVGDRMASIMSTIFIVFMIVPALAPAFGQIVLYIANWRWIFGVLLLLGSIVTLWVAFRLPETLAEENRIGIRIADIAATFGQIVAHRSSFGYMMATGVAMGALIGFITSIQQIFFDVFHEPDIFPFAFAGMAGFLAAGSFFNSRLVERVGARRLSQGSLITLILVSAGHVLVILSAMETVWTFSFLQAISLLCFALTSSNFGSISMEPFARGAGAASSFQASLTTLLSVLLGAIIGSRFDGTTLPLAIGFLLCAIGALLCVLWAERGKLFTRPHIPKMPLPCR
ncbi:multidrug effflux MFS transporter [Rhizorhapis suberifaciens]|uniref:Bcr/CflA family efflux transporter n=1 Tax=Rhizorhapis suberifaciens TaxID=13656 RepID=A0A840HTP9_9SPHN|nr:multidrug effflux MFS transporter [Rhizorhapis suberifaciens]MBB4641071.1 DHA1 family bicyclomycin/chloramphenicol resistance-like MFS transporter [Rhizorhapis suberifaciens]